MKRANPARSVAKVAAHTVFGLTSQHRKIRCDNRNCIMVSERELAAICHNAIKVYANKVYARTAVAS